MRDFTGTLWDFHASPGVCLILTQGFHRRGHKTSLHHFLKVHFGLMGLSSKSYNSTRIYEFMSNLEGCYINL